MAKVGRNDPCPCGSGKKYKKCCMMKDLAREADISSKSSGNVSSDLSTESTETFVPTARAAEVNNAFHRASNYLEKQEFDRAARAFRAVLLMAPKHYKALTGLGLCLLKTGAPEEAIRCFEKALEMNPEYVQARINLEFANEG